MNRVLPPITWLGGKSKLAPLYARDEFKLAKAIGDDPVETARRLFVRQRQSHGGLGLRWSYCGKIPTPACLPLLDAGGREWSGCRRCIGG